MTRHIMLISLMWFLKIRHELTNSTEATVPSRKQPGSTCISCYMIYNPTHKYKI